MCVCDSTAITCGKSCSIDIYINIIHIYKNVYCMDMH